MTVSTAQVLKESSAYLLSYIRVSETEARATQPTSAKSSPLRSNVHATENGYAPSPLSKRRRSRSDDDDEPLSEAPTPKKSQGDPSPRKSQAGSSPGYAPSSDDEEEEEVEHTPRTWKFKGRDSEIPAPRAHAPELLKRSPINRPSHPSPGAPGSRAERRLEKRKRSKGAPNPYKFGASPGLSNHREQGGFRRGGLGKGMKPRQKQSNNRPSFRG